MNLNNKKKLYKFFTVGIIAMLVLIFIILIISLIFGGKMSYTALENKISKVALNYVMDRSDLKPIEGKEVEINYQELVDAKKIKPIADLLKDANTTCEVTIVVKNNNENYIAFTNLDCGEKYKTNTLRKKVLEDNVIVNSADGLYNINNEYVFRGEKVNNFVKFNNELWRIVKITSTGDFRLLEVTRKETYIWDDRYNSELNYTAGINDYKVSRIKDTLDNIYETEFAKNKAYITSQNVCIGKRDSESTDQSGNIECSQVLANQYISLLEAREFTIASIDKGCIALTDNECTNYNYLATLDKTFWSITADTYKTNKVYKISSSVISSAANSRSAIKTVIHLDRNVTVTDGDGTETNPYVIKTA